MAIHIKKSHQGLLHKELGIAKGHTIPAAMLQKAARSPDAATRKRAQFAINEKKFNH